MTAEHILDAVNGLPDHLLEQTDRLRSKKKIRWQGWATAACLVLVLGIAYSFVVAPAKTADDAGAALGSLTDKAESQSLSGIWWTATVIRADRQMLTVRMVSGQERQVSLTRLQEKMEFAPGQKIRIYLEDTALLADTPLRPYKIIIEEEKS